MGAGFDGTIKIDTSINSTGFNSGIKGMMIGLKGLAGAIVGAFSIAAVVDFIKTSITAAETIRMLRGKFDTVFGGLADTVTKQLRDIEAATNFDTEDLMGFAAQMQIAFSGMGIAGEKAADMSVEVVKLSTDLAVFNNLPVEQVVDSMQMAMMGMTRGLRQYGITVDDTTIKAKAQAMGLWNGTGAMSAQTRAAATLQVVLGQTAYAQGAAAASMNTWTGQIRGITEAWNDFTEIMGHGFINALIGILPVIQAILNWLITVAQWFSDAMGFLFGVTVQTSAATTGIQGATGAVDDLGDATTKAGKAAKGALAAFDQLNVLQQEPTAPGTGGVGLGSGLGGGLGGAGVEWKKISEGWFAEFGKLWDAFWQDPWGNIVRAAQVAWALIWDAATSGASNASTWITTVAWPWIVQAAKDAWAWIVQAGKDAGPLIVKTATDVWNWIVETWGKAMDWFRTNVTNPLNALFSQAWKDIKQWIADAWQKVVDVWNGAGTWFYNNVTKPVSDWFSQAWIDITDWVKQAWTDIKAWWRDAGTWFQTWVIDPISGFFSTAWTNITGFVSGTWDAIVLAWTGASTWFQTWVINPIGTAFDTVTGNIKTAWETVFTGIGNFIKGIINNIIGFFNSLITGISGALNTVIAAANTVGSAVIPGWSNVTPIVPGQIPYLAQGAVIPPNARFAAILGDQRSGNNIEAPEALIRRIVREETGGGNGQTITINFAGNLGALMRVLKPYADKETVRIGGSLISGVTG